MSLCQSALCLPADGEAPHLAETGAQLCRARRNKLRLDALDAAALHAELLDTLAGGGVGMEEKVKGTRETVGLSLDDKAVAARTQIERVLFAWAGIVYADAFGGKPRELDRADVQRLANLIASNTYWLARHQFARVASVELDEIAHGAPYRAAYPTGDSIRTIPDYPCPHCGAELRAVMRRATSLLASHLVCAGEESHKLMPYQWNEVTGDTTTGAPVDSATAAAAAGYPDVDSFRRWARRRGLTRHGENYAARWDLAEVYAALRTDAIDDAA